MANVTFSSPVMARDVTVYAIAGDRGTILAVAKAHKITRVTGLIFVNDL